MTHEHALMRLRKRFCGRIQGAQGVPVGRQPWQVGQVSDEGCTETLPRRRARAKLLVHLARATVDRDYLNW